MKALLKVEEAAQLTLGIFLFSQLEISWWWFIGLFLAPDIGMLGYAFNDSIGAVTYNFFHHKGLAILIFLLGVYLGDKVIEFTGILLFSHSAFDRMMGYGLKYKSDFKHTHLDDIGK